MNAMSAPASLPIRRDLTFAYRLSLVVAGLMAVVAPIQSSLSG